MSDESFEVEVKEVLEEVGRSLISKNAADGDSALRPLRVFSRAGAEEGLRVRIDDQLSRIVRGDGTDDGNAVAELIGYLVLLRIALRRVGAARTQG